MNSRKRIEAACKELGLLIKSLSYSRPVMFEMGDGEGGWELETDQVSYAAWTPEGIIEYLREWRKRQ